MLDMFLQIHLGGATYFAQPDAFKVHNAYHCTHLCRRNTILCDNNLFDTGFPCCDTEGGESNHILRCPSVSMYHSYLTNHKTIHSALTFLCCIAYRVWEKFYDKLKQMIPAASLHTLPEEAKKAITQKVTSAT